MPKDTPYAGVASIFRSAIRNGEAPNVYEDGGQRRDFVHVRDVAAANVAATQRLLAGAGGSPGLLPYNVGSGHVRTVLELATALSRALDGPEPVISGRYRLGDVRHITASSARIAAELGWRAVVPFAEGVTELAHER
jgi:dTDP-L-rhamnose 4-epimerase